ncbi:MAG: hypothetical protein KDC95_12735 [Planctomycetes bacterium]|nr:hypothetical protein [Planctomycetota bacterium]
MELQPFPVASPLLRPARRSRTTALLFATMALVACGSAPERRPSARSAIEEPATPVDQDAAGRDALRAALASMFEGQPEDALRSLDQTSKYRHALDPELRGQLELAVGKANLAFARQRIASGNTGIVVNASYLDAEEAFRQAARALPTDAESLCLLSETQAEQNRFDDAVASATKAIERLGTDERPDRTAMANALVTRSKSRIYQLAEMRGDASEEPDEATLRFANEILTDLSQAKNLDPRATEPYELASTTHRWILRFEDAMRTLEDAVRAQPGHNAHHEALQGLYLGQKRGEALVGFYRKLVRETEPVSATTLWWLGKALYARAAEVRGTGDRRRADDLYRECEEAFARSSELEPSFHDSSTLYRALAAVSSARMALDEGDESTAVRELDRAYEITPRIADVDENGFDRWFDSFSKSYRGGIYAIGGLLVGGGQRLDEAVAYFRKITERHPDWGQAWNNLGLVARDFGVQREENGEADAAHKLYEESFAAYQKAAHLVPEDARIQNDTGLMLIYHLHKDHEYAITQFEKAIRIGTAQLEALPEDESDITKARRRDLEESIGDAWGNWGLALEQQQDYKGAIEKYRKSTEYYPGERRIGAKKVVELEGKIERDVRESRVAPRRSTTRPLTTLVASLAIMTGHAMANATIAVQDIDIKAALEALDQGDAEAALGIVERGIGKSTDAERWYCAGVGSLLFAKKQMANNGSGVEANLIDAIDRLKKAITIADGMKEPAKHLGNRIHTAPARFAIEAMNLKGEADAALELGKRQLSHLDSLGIEFDGKQLAALYGQIASAAVRVATTAYQNADEAAPKAAEDARAMYVRYEKACATLDAQTKAAMADDIFATARAAATLEEWAKRGVAALRLWDRAAALLPADRVGAIAGELSGIASRTSSAETASTILESWMRDGKGDAATLAWYVGYVKILRGHEFRAGGENEKAVKAYDDARKDFRTAMTKNSGFTANSKYMIGMAHAAEGAALKSAEKSEDAIASWMEAVKTDPRVALQPDALGQTAQGGVMLEVDALYQGGKLDEAAKLAERYLAALGSDDKNILNNIGFFWREFAGRQSGTARTKAYEASWNAYKRAAALASDDPRVLNDTALIDIYYLKRYPKESEQLLRQAIKAGEAKMENDPPQDEREKNALEEAIGDAYMNLGVLFLDDEKRWDEAQEVLERSLDFYPPQRASARHLARLDAMRKKKGDGDKEGDGKK